jgi:DNA-binding transcriptional LysR family regulator
MHLCDMLAHCLGGCRGVPGRFDVTNIDLKLLAVVTDLHKTRSVSQTAENLDLSQSAVSMSLAKLRKLFNDPLFVRTSSGMNPTPHAVELIGLLKNAEDILQTALDLHVVFDPMRSERRFNVYSSDIAQITLMPRLMQRLKSIAPNVGIDLRSLSDATPKQLESGEADLAVGFIQPLGAGFCQQRLFKERFVCVARKDHPRVGDTVSIEEFQNETPVAIATCGTGHGVVEKALEAKSIHRRVGLTVPSFLGIASIITTLDYLAVLPEQLARHLARTESIKLLALPFGVPSYHIMQHWHERYTQDPASKWLRSVVASLFLSS